MKTISFVLAFSICALLNLCETDAQDTGNVTICGSTPCMNGGKCLTNGNPGSTYCDCTGTGYTGYDCREKIDNIPSCRYHYCENGGICVRDKGFEYCDCTDTDFGGIRCDLRNASCDDMPCKNNGSCTDIAGGLRYCTCPEMYGGVDCQYYTAYEMCPSISSDDMTFLPKCSLKSTLSSLSRCINNNLPYQDPDKEMCYGKITQTEYCIYDTIAQCSGLMCDSVYNYGGSQVYANIANTLYDPESEFNVALREILCALPENGSYSFPTELFNIGEPVCSKDLIDRLLKELIVFANRQLNNNDTNICGLLDDLRVNIYNITKSDCDWSKITEALPELYKSDDATYFQRLLEIAQEYFLEWRVYGCEVRYNQTACGNGTCFNGGRCVQHGYYIGINYTHYEYCDCSGTGYDGEYCDTVPISVCDGYCANGGVCSETFGIPFCACPPGLGGPRCEMHDPINYCRTAGPNDVEFLPLCTLRNTTEQLVDCVVHNMAGVAFGAMDNGTCLHGIHQTFTCVGNVIGNCSRSTCPSIYHLPGVGETVKMIVEGMFSPEVMYTISQYVCSPIPAGGYVQFLGDIPDVNLAPICPSVTLNDMVDILRVLENGLLYGSQDLSSVCRVISQAQDMAYQLSTRCDMSGVISLLPPGYEVLGPYIQRGFNAIQNMLSNYTFPFCRGVDPGPAPGMCPMITYQSSQCEMVDAWMCQQFMRRKELSSWMEEFMVWWRTCSGFAERDWDHWASSMGLRRGDKYGGYGTNMGEDGFVRVIKANHQCTSYSSMDCYDGWTFTDVLGCTHCYRRGTTGRNTRSLFMMWMDDYQEYMTTMKIYNALRQDCAGSFTGGCGGGGGGGVPPTMPPYGTTPNTGSPWPWATTTMPYPYPEGTTFPQWPWASSSTPQWPWASSSTPQWPWPWTTASMPHPYPEKTTGSVPQWPWTTPSHPYLEETTGSVPQWPGATPTTPHAYPEESTDSGS